MKAGAALPNIPELVGELTVPTYTFVGGKFVLEEKDQIKVRLGRSPDLADALALTFAVPDMPSEVMQRMQGRGVRCAIGIHTSRGKQTMTMTPTPQNDGRLFICR